MRVKLRDLSPGQDYLLQFRTTDGNNSSPWSPVYKFRTNGDIVAPLPPTNLQWAGNGASFVGSWTAPTLDNKDASGTNKPLKDFKDFEVTVTNEANTISKVYYTTTPAFELTLPMNAAAFGGIELTVTITVKSRDLTGNLSDGVSKTAIEDTPPVPSPPVVTNNSGQLTITWDGTTSLGTINPFNLAYVEIHASTTNNFTPSPATSVGQFQGWITGTQMTVVPVLAYGVPNYFKLVSVNRKGKKSAPSLQAQGTPKRITGLDIDANGNLSASQMNFTARALGGANAFYGTTTPTGSAAPDGTVYKDGDVFYNISVPPAANAGKTYRLVSGVWTVDNNIGVIAGTKILTNTLTADAVGANQIITSKANIGTAMIDTGHIDFLSASKITSGVLQSTATVTFGGLTQPAWSMDIAGNASLNNVSVRGQMIVGSAGNTGTQNAAFSVRSYNYVSGTSGWTINGDGTVEFGAAVMRGSFKTAAQSNVRRIEILSAGDQGSMDFYSPQGDRTYIRSLTEANAEGLESIQIGLGDPATAWTRGIINMNQGGFISMRGKIQEHVVGREWRLFTLTTAADTLQTNNPALSRIVVDNDSFTYRGKNGNVRLAMDAIGSDLMDPAGKVRLAIDGTTVVLQDTAEMPRLSINTSGVVLWDAAGRSRLFIADKDSVLATSNTNVYLNMNGTDGSIELKGGLNASRTFTNNGEVRFGFSSTTSASIVMADTDNTNRSPALSFFSGSGHGARWQLYQDNRGVWLEARAWDDSAWTGIRVGGFENLSDARTKSDIRDYDTSDILRQIKNTKVRSYKRNKGTDDPGIERHEIGLIAQEAPRQIVSSSDDPETMQAIDIYQMNTMLWGAVQELTNQVDALIAQINKKEK